MSKLSAVPTPPVVTVAELNARADRILPQIAAGAAQR